MPSLLKSVLGEVWCLQDQWVLIKGGVWKMFSVKSGNPLSLIMGVPNKTSLCHLDIVDTGATFEQNYKWKPT